MEFAFQFPSINVYILVFMRMVGMVALNPMFERRNVPSQVRIALMLGLTLLLAPTAAAADIAGYNMLDMVLGMMRELVVGLTFSYVFVIFYYLLFTAGDLMDVQFGISMAKVFDPGTQIQMSVSGNLLNVLFILYVFVTDSHLLLIRLMASSFEVLPAGAWQLSSEAAGFLLTLFTSVFSLSLRLALPFVAAEFVLEISMGILMKLIPQIHVFVINIQLKILMGLFLLLAFAAPVASFVEYYMTLMFEQMQKVLYVLAG